MERALYVSLVWLVFHLARCPPTPFILQKIIGQCSLCWTNGVLLGINNTYLFSLSLNGHWFLICFILLMVVVNVAMKMSLWNVDFIFLGCTQKSESWIIGKTQHGWQLLEYTSQWFWKGPFQVALLLWSLLASVYCRQLGLSERVFHQSLLLSYALRAREGLNESGQCQRLPTPLNCSLPELKGLSCMVDVSPPFRTLHCFTSFPISCVWLISFQGRRF